MTVGEVRQRSRTSLSFGGNSYLDFSRFAHLFHLIEEGVPRSLLVEKLGISRSKVSNLLALARGFDLLKRGHSLKLTALGRVIHTCDPHFEDIGTLWFLHYVVSSEPRQFVWNQFASLIFPQTQQFTLRDFRAKITDLRVNRVTRYAKRCINHETRVVLDAYGKKDFERTGYLLQNEKKRYIAGTPAPLPPFVLGASIVRYRDHHHPDSATILVSHLLSEPNGPGVIFQLGQEQLRTMLEQIKLHGIEIESRAELDQIRLPEKMTDIKWMELYYGAR